MVQAIHQVLAQYNHWANEKLFGHLSSDLVKEKVTARYQELIRGSLVELDGLTVAFLSFLGISSGTTNLTESTPIESVCAVILNTSGALLAHLDSTDTESCQPITSESLLSFTNKSTQIRGTISGFLCMCGLKPLALDALYIKPCKEVTDPQQLELFRLHAKQNMEAYTDLIKSIEALTDEAYHSNCGLCFRSVHGTLNHMVMGETVWYDVLRGKDASRFDAYWERPDEELYSNAESTSSLWETWCPDRDELKERIRKQSALWSEYVDGLDGFEHPTEKFLGLVLFHVVNHGWHHRGQIYAALRVIGK